MEKQHAPKTGPGFSAGKEPPKVAKDQPAPHPKASDGNHQQRRQGDSKSSHEGSGNWPGGRAKG